MKATKICIVTGSRSEFGLLTPLLIALKNDPDFNLQLLVTGMHLSPEFGNTYTEIESLGFIIDEKIDMLLSADTDTAIAKSMGLGFIGYADAFDRLQPDWLLVLGDRFETFAAATTAYMKKIPIAHLHGGEVTAGATDEALRHSITKMSALHFTSTEEYRKRVMQLGEHQDVVFNVGAIGLDNIRELSLLDKAELEKALNFSLAEDVILVTFHPVTLERISSKEQMQELLDALDSFGKGRIIFTMPNADAGGRPLRHSIKKFTEDHKDRSTYFESLGQLKYLSLMKYSAAIVGNSSSGIIEAPSLGVPSINIGDRQKGRVTPASVIQCAPQKSSILDALKKAFDVNFRMFCKNVQTPYGDGHAVERIVSVLKKNILPTEAKKQFIDRI